ncbi:MAG TPA: hypothetical protein VM681_02090 [Candidatus Thermoplasmatota archaeon]|nr:hypothetical protein [Candidatus Thermoplasmatota archaeon]
MSLPKAYLALLALVGLAFAAVALTATGVVTVESVFLLLLNYVFQVFAVTVLAALGGVFVGMLLAHRILSTRGFSAFERELLETLGDVRERLDDMKRHDQALAKRIEILERQVR